MLLKGIALVSVLLAVLVCGLSGGFTGFPWIWILSVGFLGSFLVLLILAFLFLWIACCLVRLDKPQERDSKFYRQMAYLYIDALAALAGVRLHTRGLENTPKGGRFLLVCNHQHIADPALLLISFKKSQLAFISKQENENLFVVGKIMHKIMCQSINRDNDRQALKTILKCIQLIKEDQVSIGVFPEGYTSRDGKLHRFRSGAFKIAQKAKVPIVVCTIQNTREIFHNLPRLKHTDVELHLVGVIPAAELEGQTTVDISDRVYRMMLSDLGPDYAPAEPPAPENTTAENT